MAGLQEQLHKSLDPFAPSINLVPLFGSSEKLVSCRASENALNASVFPSNGLQEHEHANSGPEMDGATGAVGNGVRTQLFVGDCISKLTSGSGFDQSNLKSYICRISRSCCSIVNVVLFHSICIALNHWYN